MDGQGCTSIFFSLSVSHHFFVNPSFIPSRPSFPSMLGFPFFFQKSLTHSYPSNLLTYFLFLPLLALFPSYHNFLLSSIHPSFLLSSFRSLFITPPLFYYCHLFSLFTSLTQKDKVGTHIQQQNTHYSISLYNVIFCLFLSGSVIKMLKSRNIFWFPIKLKRLLSSVNSVQPLQSSNWEHVNNV